MDCKRPRLFIYFDLFTIPIDNTFNRQLSSFNTTIFKSVWDLNPPQALQGNKKIYLQTVSSKLPPFPSPPPLYFNFLDLILHIPETVFL
jgi:hypothetical protein